MATSIFTEKSPSAQVGHGRPVPAKAMEKKMAVSTADPIDEETSGARHQEPARSG